MTDRTTAPSREPARLTPNVLAAMMRETLELMDQTVELLENDAPETLAARAGAVRAAARLARVAGWLAAQSADAGEHPTARREASAALAAASGGALDRPTDDAPIDAMRARVARLTDRAARLDAWLNPPRRETPSTATRGTRPTTRRETAPIPRL